MVGLIILLVSVISSLFVGATVVLQNVKHPTNLIYGLLTACFVGLCVANYMTLYPTEQLLTYMRVVIFFTTLATFTILLLVSRIVHQPIVRAIFRPSFIWTFTIVTGAIAVLNLTPVVFSGLSEGGTPVPGAGIILFVGHFILTLGLAITFVGYGMRHSRVRQEREQLRIVTLAVLPLLVLASVTSIILPVFLGLTGLIVLSPLYVAYFVIMIGYAIIRHGLFDIRQAVVRSAAYILAIGTLAAGYYVVAYLLSIAFFRGQVSDTFSVNPINITLALVLAFIFQPIKSFFDRVTDSIFFRDRYDSDDFFARFNEVLVTTTGLRGLLQRAAQEVSKTLKSSQAFFYVQYGDIHYVSAGTKGHSLLTLKDSNTLGNYVEKHGNSIIITEQLPGDNSIRRLLIDHKIAILMPLAKHDRPLGYLALGDQQVRGYTNHDMKVLATISDGLLIAIQNALSLQEVKDINESLAQRIKGATKELRENNTQLRKLDEAKDEFVSMASHQLRTPLTSVKGYISMVLEGDAGKLTKMQRQLLDEAFTSSERMVHLINDFLNVSRLQTGKFVIEAKPIDLAKVVEQEVNSLKTTAAAHNLKLDYRAPSYFPILYIDEGKIRQVLMNFIDNAIYYSHEHTTISVKLSIENGEVVATVHDTGIGVPKGEQAHLFTKFFRATNARRQRPDGTGVGLFLAKKVIVAHGGSMVFESAEGEGSTFGFRLPVKQLSSAPDDGADELGK